MVEMQDYSSIVSRICPHEADDIDYLVASFDPRAAATGADVFPEVAAVLMPEVGFKRVDAICVGFRLATELADAPDRALRLAAMALERDVEIIVLSEIDLSGLERFGFRTERISSCRADAFLDQVRRFWSLDLVL